LKKFSTLVLLLLLACLVSRLVCHRSHAYVQMNTQEHTKIRQSKSKTIDSFVKTQEMFIWRPNSSAVVNSTELRMPYMISKVKTNKLKQWISFKLPFLLLHIFANRFCNLFAENKLNIDSFSKSIWHYSLQKTKKSPRERKGNLRCQFHPK